MRSARWAMAACVVLSTACSSCLSTAPEDLHSVGQEARACPEAVTPDERGQPRNAAGQIRYCWPSEARCHCDSDNDCYAQSGYRACTPVNPDAGARDAGARDVGTIDSGPRDVGTTDSGPRDAGSMDAGPRDAGTLDSGPRDTGVVDTGPRDTGVVDTGPRDTGVVDAGSGGGTIPVDTVSYSGSFPAQTGRRTARITVLGEARDVVVYVPQTRPANPPLVLLFHGTNGSGEGVFDEANAASFAAANGVVVVAPSSRWMSSGDWDHRTEETYWQTAPNLNVDTNQDLVLARALIAESIRRWSVDPRRVYAAGHSNGGFFALTVAARLANRVAAFATSSAGLVRCGNTWGCSFEGSGTTCATLSTRSGWCSCSGSELPAPLPTSGPPLAGYLAHGTRDPLVSVQYTCELASRMTALGYPVTVNLRNGDGHVLPGDFLTSAWAFLAPRRR
ncbi:MAG: PHB depolymerase family esterase [Polyangiales bacterium]